MKAATTFALSVLALLPFVSAHGYVSQVTIDGTSYKGNTPGSSSVKSAIRMIADVSPVKGATNQYLSCGQNAQKASTVATASPGSKVSFKWSAITGGNWFHNVGPLMTYMASCGTAGCTSFNSSAARWFKIAQAGLQSDGTWAQAALLTGAPATVSLPSNIAPGEYLIRHEIIALHTAMTSGGAEFYPSCTQLKIGGSKTGAPNATVSFPGAYKDTDAGILVDVYDLVGSYVFPGPTISNLSGKTSVASSNSTTTASNSETSSAYETVSSTSTESASASSVSPSTSATAFTTATTEDDCEDEADAEPTQLSRRFSRVMRAVL